MSDAERGARRPPPEPHDSAASGGGSAHRSESRTTGANGWVLRLDRAAPGAQARLLALRHAPGVVACLEDGALWVRGPDASDAAIDAALRRSGGARFGLDPDGQLVPDGARLPGEARPPGGPWRPLGELLRLAAPPARAVVRDPPPAAPLALVRDPQGPGEVDACGLLVVAARTYAAWAVDAPAVRLAPLRVAARGDAAELLVRGTPLPPLPGARFALEGPLAVPAGLRLEPAVDAATLAALLLLEPDDLLLVHGAEGPPRLERVPGPAFVAASRGAARDLLAADGAAGPARSP